MLNLTQEEIAKKLGITKSAYNEKETGKRDFKDREKRALLELFKPINSGLTIDELFFSNVLSTKKKHAL